MTRGTLRIYLGAAPGVGKTFAMLNEGARRAARGADVVVGFVETHGRTNTKSQIGDLPIVRRLSTPYRGTAFDEMDIDAVLARKPKVVLVDELAHTNNPTMRNPKRWQDVEELLEAGIDVISTLNVQHLESLNDVVERITGITQQETVPDSFVRSADQIELVDMSPEALRRRMAHGNIYPAEKVDAALANYFRPGNLGALRELALLWLADRVEDSLQDYLSDHGITSTWETRERVVVALTGAPGGDNLVRRAARMAGRLHGDLIGVHVGSSDGLSKKTGDGLERQRALLIELGGTYREVVSDDVAGALAAFATSEQATQVILGSTRRSRISEMLHGSLVADVQRGLPGVDVHIISGPPTEPAPRAAPARRRQWLTAAPSRRELLGWALCLVGVPLLTAILVALDDHLNVGSALLLHLTLVLCIAALGGIRPSVVASVGAVLLTNYYLAPPTHRWTIDSTNDVVALSIFIAVAVVVSLLVDQAARRARDARRARADATALARSTGSIIATADPLPELVDQLRTLFSLAAVSVLDRAGDQWVLNTSSGPNPPLTPDDGTAFPLDEHGDTQLVMRGPTISGDDLMVLRAFTDQVALGLEARHLRRDAQTIESLSEANALRSSLLQAVSHDLRTPLASIKASVTGLLGAEVGFTDEQRVGLLANIDAATDRLDRVIGNLLDMSRLQAGAARPTLGPAALEEIIAASLSALSAPADRVQIDVDPDLPLVFTDPALLERAVANLVSNALSWGGSEHPVRIEAVQLADRVALRIIDRGPGIPVADRERLLEPFQRRGNRSSDAGAGLGLAIAKGFIEVTGGSMEIDDTPGGGATITVAIPISPETDTQP